MRLTRVYIRHYKSFNFDYERKAVPKATEEPWEVDDGGWQPFVDVPLEEDITAVVGANESGKSHLLDAIEILLGARAYGQNDFCRYSSVYSVEQGRRRYPQFAGLFTVTDSDRSALQTLGLPLRSEGAALIVRLDPNQWAAVTTQGALQPLDPAQAPKLLALLPTSFRLKTDMPLPDALSIRRLSGRTALAPRRPRTGVLDLLNANPAPTPDGMAALVPALLAALFGAPDPTDDGSSAQQQLGQDLLQKIARIEISVFTELADAILDADEGPVNGLIQRMNESISRHLNLERWWTQDRSFSLRVSPREHELVFTIHDRTGTDYSFAERSMGLRYFLSYFVQLRAHQRVDARPEILLMDEPDTYLSASGQQDLLRVLENYARPEGLTSDDQVIYVTHSPFLLNKNAGRRARVIDKGSGDEGTRLVLDATQNRYEPLRSAIGAYVAETAFIGGTNLFVEGASDQIYLVEMTNRLRLLGTPASRLIDLNSTTIVGAGSASAIPYMVYLARGQDEIKPACVVLLDSDQSGADAARALRRGGAYRKQLLADDHIRTLGTWAEHAEVRLAEGVVLRETEDLLPLGCAAAAAQSYATSFLGISADDAGTFTPAAVQAALPASDGSLFDALAAVFQQQFDTHLEKVGFAKEVTRLLSSRNATLVPPDAADADHNFGQLVSHLADALRLADRLEEDARRDKQLDRVINAFLRDFPEKVTKDRADVALRDAEAAAGESEQGDSIRATAATIRRDFALSLDPLHPVEDYPAFKDRLSGLRYVERLANQGRLPEPVDAERTDPGTETVHNDSVPLAESSSLAAPPATSTTAPSPEPTP
jgi:hypothetical protein